MRAKLFAATVLVATPASATDATIVDACVRAAEHYFHADGLKPSGVQAFPELNPPRVRALITGPDVPAPLSERLTIMLNGKSGSERSTETVCEFQSASAPFGITHFDCGVCLITNDRFEEIQLLLKREGL